MKLNRTRSIPSAIQNTELAGHLTKSELRRLDQTGTIVNLRRGHEIIAEASTGQECFVIIDGELSVVGPEIDATIGAGDITGELALMTGQPRTATVTTTTDSKLYALSRREFTSLLDHAPRFRSVVVTSANDRLGRHNSLLPARYRQQSGPSWSQRLADTPSWQPLS